MQSPLRSPLQRPLRSPEKQFCQCLGLSVSSFSEIDDDTMAKISSDDIEKIFEVEPGCSSEQISELAYLQNVYRFLYLMKKRVHLKEKAKFFHEKVRSFGIGREQDDVICYIVVATKDVPQAQKFIKSVAGLKVKIEEKESDESDESEEQGDDKDDDKGDDEDDEYEQSQGKYEQCEDEDEQSEWVDWDPVWNATNSIDVDSPEYRKECIEQCLRDLNPGISVDELSRQVEEVYQGSLNSEKKQ